MATSALETTPSSPPAPIDLAPLKARQQGAWASGDYAVVGTTLQIVGEGLCEALDLRAGQTVLDVAAGNGNASLAAARRWCDVVATDYVPLERARERAEAERLAIAFREANAEALPFEDENFDVVVSTFGVMFTPDQERAASELVRATKRAAKSAWQTGRREASSARSSRPSASTYRRRPATSRRRGGERGRGWPNSSSRRRPRSNRRTGTSCFDTARPSTGWRSYAPTTARCSRPSRHSRPQRKRRANTISSDWPRFNSAGDARWQCRASTRGCYHSALTPGHSAKPSRRG
ncbi:MAG: SAM-dependent methyltransferase [Microvirga sp.]|nr:SAM-dependent methyltransferase [Microvirga sp.]